MTAALLVAGLAALATGACCDLVPGASHRIARVLPYGLALAGSALLLAAGAAVISTGQRRYALGDLLAAGTTTVRVDDLAAMFLVVLFALALAVSACAISWVSAERGSLRRGAGAAYCTLLGSVAVILVAADTFLFLFAWETLTLSFYVLAAIGGRDRGGAGAAWLTLVSGQAGGACLLVGLLLLAGRSGSLLFSTFPGVPAGAARDAAYALVVAGFAAKLGVVPLQAWVPVGYPAAPAPVRAAMAGIAANVGVYGLWRFLGVLGRPQTWLVVAVLVLGGTTALLGICFAGVQSRLSRVVAYSSVENAGIIFTGFGVALAGAASGHRLLEAAGLLAATLHTVAHAVAKSALFSAAASVEQRFGTDDLEQLRGVGRRLPLTASGFAAGALTLAGLPPTVGFVSEWFVLESLMQEFRLPGLAIRLGMAAAGALVALTTGLAALAFLRILALVFLGRPSPSAARWRDDAGTLGIVGLAILGGACFGLAAVTPLEIRFLADGLLPVMSKSLSESALKSPWVLQPTYPGFSILSPSWLYVVMPVALVAVTLAAIGVSHGRYFKLRRVPAWHSAVPRRPEPSSYTPFAFANPLRHVLANVLGTRNEERPLGSGADDVRGRGPVEYSTEVVEPVERYLYAPLRSAAMAVSALLRRLQSGRLDAYVGYMLVVLIVALAVAAALR
jgi:hydrogenase-4 component B